MTDTRLSSLQNAAGPVSRETFEALVRFEAVFQKWNQRINLAAPSTMDDVWFRHIVDSAQLVPHAQEARRWLDLGSGGGFPGLVLAFLMKDKSGYIDLVESNRKKAGFLQAMIGEFGLPARVVARRIEDAVGIVGQPDVVTARALASLPLLLDLASPWLLAGATAFFHKGRDYRSEVEESCKRWSFGLVEHKSSTDSEGALLEISSLSRL